MDIRDVSRLRSLLSLASQISDPSQIQQIVLLPPYTREGKVGDADVVFPIWSEILPLVRRNFP
jgi:hypothetical protein